MNWLDKDSFILEPENTNFDESFQIFKKNLHSRTFRKWILDEKELFLISGKIQKEMISNSSTLIFIILNFLYYHC